MLTSASDLIQPYLQALGSGFRLGKAPDGTTVVSTPFRFATGDPLEIAVWEEADGLVLSDRGGLIRSLLVAGIDAFKPGRARSRVASTLAPRRAELDGATVISPVGEAGAGRAVQNLVQSLLDAQVAAESVMRPHGPAMETETYSVIREVLDDADERYREGMRIAGATTRRYQVDFQLAFATSGIIRAVLVVARHQPLAFAERWNFRFRDIRAARPRLHRIVAVDAATKWTSAAQKTLESECEMLVSPGEPEQLSEYLRNAAPIAA